MRDLDPIDQAALLLLEDLAARVRRGAAVIVGFTSKDTAAECSLAVAWADPPGGLQRAVAGDEEDTKPGRKPPGPRARLTDGDLCPSCPRGVGILRDAGDDELQCLTCGFNPAAGDADL